VGKNPHGGGEDKVPVGSFVSYGPNFILR